MSAPPALKSKPNPTQSLDEQAKSDPESAVFVILTLGLLLGLQPLATDLYLHALPQLWQDFGGPISQAQLTLTGFLLAFGIQAALLRQATEGGSWRVRVTLAGTARWLRSLGRVEVASEEWTQARADISPYLETLDSGFGRYEYQWSRFFIRKGQRKVPL